MFNFLPKYLVNVKVLIHSDIKKQSKKTNQVCFKTGNRNNCNTKL